MKKTIWIIVICLCLFAALAAWALSRGASEPAPESSRKPVSHQCFAGPFLNIYSS